MSWALALFVVAGFAWTIGRLGLPGRVRGVLSTARHALDVLRDPGLTDDQKGAEFRRISVRFARVVAVFLGGSVLALAWPLLVVWGLERLSLAELADVWSVLESPSFLVAVAVAGSAVWAGYRRWRGGEVDSEGSGDG